MFVHDMIGCLWCTMKSLIIAMRSCVQLGLGVFAHSEVVEYCDQVI